MIVLFIFVSVSHDSNYLEWEVLKPERIYNGHSTADNTGKRILIIIIEHYNNNIISLNASSVCRAQLLFDSVEVLISD